jgi:WXG100 family type VII secretion target
MKAIDSIFDAGSAAKTAIIEMNFAEAKAQANRLDDIASDMKRLAEKGMSEAISQLSSGWKGESATAYFAKSELLRNNILTTAQQIAEIADNIRRIAQRIYEAEMKALSIAQQRTSGVGAIINGKGGVSGGGGGGGTSW